MSDLIDRSDAIKAIQKSTEEYTGFMGMEMYTDEDAIKALMSVPTEEAIPVEWIEKWEEKNPYAELGDMLNDWKDESEKRTCSGN